MVGCVCHNTPLVFCVDDDGERELGEDEIEKRFHRMNGDVVCEFCEEKAYKHPLDKRILSFDDEPYLHRMCNGTLAKL